MRPQRRSPVRLGRGAIVLFLALLLRAQVYYPWKDVQIGGLEGQGWCGLTLIPTKDAGFGFRFKIEKDGALIDGDNLFYMVSEVGPKAPDGVYARVRFDLSLPVLPADSRKDTPILIKPSPPKETLTLEWSRQDEDTVIGRLTAPAGLRVHLLTYFPWDFKGVFRTLADGLIQGDARAAKPARFLLWTDRPGEPGKTAEGEEAEQVFPTDRERVLRFAAGVGEDLESIRTRLERFRRRKTIDGLLEEEEARYAKKRVLIKGDLFAGAPESITNNLYWMVLYQPGAHRLYTPAGRRWIFPRPDGGPDHWTIFAWDSFFNALELAVESPKLAVDAIRAVLETQYPNGNIPNWRGRFGGTPDRSEPPVGAYCTLKLFQRLGDMDLLKTAYPVLRRWHAFWKARRPNGQPRRDGNGDGLLEWGSDSGLLADKSQVPPWEQGASGEQRAKWESGQDDLPNWDDVPFDAEAGTLTMNCLDLNCLYALDASCLAQMAAILGRRDESDAYQAEYEKIRELINDQLWNPRENFYFDRHWDGRFSTRKAASNFYPLLARIPDERRARLMLRRLLNPKEFWGDYVLPSISRDDPAFKDQQYWRGSIWPPTNYLVYQGLKAYGFDIEGSEFAARSAGLFLRTWRNFQLCPENFDARTGEAAGQRYQSWGPLFALMALEEYLDFTPWEGFRFGLLKPESKGTLSHLAVQGRSYDVEVGPKRIRLLEDDREIFAADGGAVVRHFLYSENEVSFEIASLRPREVLIRFLREGKYQLLVDNAPREVFRGDSFRIDVPAGTHSILFQLLEGLDNPL
ncbi:MAG: trehalase family glycosidase [Candidatus Aminicenantes bacterium]|nr:trehalase family glycosidase [Candidatus Aminicenantes bacterium]